MQSNPFSLMGKTAVVIGTAAAIARETALAFGLAGAGVVSADIDEPGALATAELVSRDGAAAFGMRADVAQLADMRALVEATLERFGSLDVLVYGAALREATATVLEIEPAVWDAVVRVNLTGAYLACKAAIPAMAAGGGGSIILIASQRARVGSAGRAPYCATKGALVQLAKVLAIDHAPDNIRANTLSPGSIESERTADRYGGLAAARVRMGPQHVLGRMGLPHEVAYAAVYLASDASSFVTGSDLLVDGGYTAL